ncbi:MAG: ATP-binding cassette domain-containing protein [bacterium]|nr:ATP-binding cassette domain-containing protein [bacterium]
MNQPLHTSILNPSTLAISAEKISYVYPGFDRAALMDLTFDLRTGATLAILGANGSGKSTLAKLIAGLLQPSSGSLQVLGEDIVTPSGRDAIIGRVGIVFQSPDEQMVATTVEREIAFGPENLGIPSTEIRRRVDDLMQRFDLAQYKLQSPHLLSGGEKQKVALAAVLAMQPQLLILDEVTSLLDPLGRSEVRALISQLRTQCTIILISQFPDEALLADRLILMRQGSIVKDAPPAEIFLAADSPENYGIDLPLYFRLLKAVRCADNPGKSG